jgi:hypothetical protein
MPVVPTPDPQRLHRLPDFLAGCLLFTHPVAPPQARPVVGKSENMLDTTYSRICVLRTYVLSNVEMAPGQPGAVIERNINFPFQACHHSALKKPMILVF